MSLINAKLKYQLAEVILRGPRSILTTPQPISPQPLEITDPFTHRMENDPEIARDGSFVSGGSFREVVQDIKGHIEGKQEMEQLQLKLESSEKKLKEL